MSLLTFTHDPVQGMFQNIAGKDGMCEMCFINLDDYCYYHDVLYKRCEWFSAGGELVLRSAGHMCWQRAFLGEGGVGGVRHPDGPVTSDKVLGPSGFQCGCVCSYE